MTYTNLGRSGLRVSRICLGTGAFGQFEGGSKEYGGVPKEEAFKIMDAALDAGINFFDTANVYGGVGHRGAAEVIIGEWFAQGGNRRERVVLGTKVGRMFEQDDIDGPNQPEGLSLYKIRRHVEASFRRLQTDHLELYQMHKPFPNMQWDELWEAFEGLVRQGKVDYVGCCNFRDADLLEAQAVAGDRHFMGLVSAQHRYNLLDRHIEPRVAPTARRLGIGITAWSPMDRGLLAVDPDEADGRLLSKDARAGLDGARKQLAAFSGLCKELGEPMPSVALAWLLAQPGLNCPVIGPSSVEEVDDAVRAAEIDLDAETLARLDDIFPV